MSTLQSYSDKVANATTFNQAKNSEQGQKPGNLVNWPIDLDEYRSEQQVYNRVDEYIGNRNGFSKEIKHLNALLYSWLIAPETRTATSDLGKELLSNIQELTNFLSEIGEDCTKHREIYLRVHAEELEP